MRKSTALVQTRDAPGARLLPWQNAHDKDPLPANSVNGKNRNSCWCVKQQYLSHAKKMMRPFIGRREKIPRVVHLQQGNIEARGTLTIPINLPCKHYTTNTLLLHITCNTKRRASASPLAHPNARDETAYYRPSGAKHAPIQPSRPRRRLSAALENRPKPVSGIRGSRG